jgi:hypothetical protein
MRGGQNKGRAMRGGQNKGRAMRGGQNKGRAMRGLSFFSDKISQASRLSEILN